MIHGNFLQNYGPCYQVLLRAYIFTNNIKIKCDDYNDFWIKIPTFDILTIKDIDFIKGIISINDESCNVNNKLKSFFVEVYEHLSGALIVLAINPVKDVNKRRGPSFDIYIKSKQKANSYKKHYNKFVYKQK